ncbi:RepB-like protein, partial [Lentilactobacillus kefiri]|uniref:RepB-like protein n=1 Tax=Lentilactobacillus kefiri TaxID=33962 RepID=UPI000BA6E86F
TVYVNVDGQKAIKSMFSKDSSTRDRQQKDDIDDNKKDDVDEQDEVKFLQNLVSEIQSEKKELHKLLDQQQRLALQDKKLLEEYKAEIKDLKALAMPSREDEKDVSSQSETEQETKPTEAQTKPKKWWRFGKS